MHRVSIEQSVIVGFLVVMLLINCSLARPRRRFCENFPYARKCLGVSAKRSAQRLDLQNRVSSEFLSSLLRRLYDEEAARDLSAKRIEMQDGRDLYDESAFLDKLASMVGNTNKQQRRALQETTYINDDPTWDDNFETSKSQL